MDVSGARKLKDLETENTPLKPPVAEQLLVIERLKGFAGKNDSRSKPLCRAPISGYWRALLSSRSLANQRSQRQERTNGDVFMVHQVLFRQWQRFHDGVGFVNGLRVKKENHASAVAP